MTRHARLAALGGALCIAFSGIFFRFSGTTPATATVFRCLYALPFLGLIALGERRRLGPFGGRAHAVGAVAGIFFALDLLLWQHAVLQVGAGLATVTANLQVVVVAAAAWAVLGERPSRSILVAIPVMLVGVGLISGILGAHPYGADPRLGVLMGAGSAIAYGGFLLLTRQLNVGGPRPATVLFDATSAAAAAGAVLGTLLGEFDPVPAWPAHGWLVLVALTSQVGGYLLISSSLPRLPAALTSSILLAQPIATVALAAVLLGESPSIFQLGGVALVILGLAVATTRPAVRPVARGPIPEVEGAPLA